MTFEIGNEYKLLRKAGNGWKEAVMAKLISLAPYNFEALDGETVEATHEGATDSKGIAIFHEV